MTHLSLAFFGAFRVSLDDKPLTTFRSIRVQGLLVYLTLAHPLPHRRDTLATLFWPHEVDTVARKNLRQSLYQLRQVLGDTSHREVPYLLVTRSTVQFNKASAHTLDVATFLASLEDGRLEQAVALYRGDLLPGFICGSPPFEEWLRMERERFHRLALDALFERTARSLAQADYRTARDLAQRQLSLEPWREEAHRQLIQALALLDSAGRSAALVQYETCRAVLKEELGIEPSVETKSLVARIRKQRSVQRGPRPLAHPTRPPRLTVPFVGRRREHAILVHAYRRACRTGVQVVTLVGEAGIGKTRLAQNFLAWAASEGADILHGRAFETSAQLFYQPLIQAIRRRLEQENAPEDLLSDLWLAQLTRVLPELRDRYPDLPEPIQGEALVRQHLFEAIARLGEALATRSPLVFFIDDWHWADPASLEMLHYAVSHWFEKGMPILLLLTLRQEAFRDTPDLRAWLARIRHDVGCTQVNITALSEMETGELMGRLLKSEQQKDMAGPVNAGTPLSFTYFSHWLFEETGGQPFFLVETLKALTEARLLRPDPYSETWLIDWTGINEHGLKPYVLQGVREIVRGWLDRISAPAAELLTAAAVLNQKASFENLRLVAGLEEKQALKAIDELRTRQLLVEADDALPTPVRNVIYIFSHQKLAEGVYAEAGAARRRVLHRRAFVVLQEAGIEAAALAHHALQGGLWAESIHCSMAAGHEAMDLLAVRVALAHYETAYRLGEERGWPEAISGADRQALYANLGRAYELTAAWSQAQEIYRSMISFARSIEAPSLECSGLNHLATVSINGFGKPRQAIALLEQARTVAEQNGDRRGMAETEWNLSLAARMVQDVSLAHQHGEQALSLARQLGHPQLLARCLNSLAYVHGRLRQWDTVEAYACEAGHLYAIAGNRFLEADCQRLAGWGQMYTGRPQDSLVTLQKTLDFSQRIENLWGEAECAWRLALTCLELGRYGEAIHWARKGVKQARVVGQPTMNVLALSTWGTVQRRVMALEAARETLLEALRESTEKGLAGFRDWAPAELCALHALTEEWEQAYLYAKQTLQFRKEGTLLPMSLSGWYTTEALLRGGDSGQARAEVERVGSIMGSNKRFRLPWLRSLAVLAQWDGHLSQAIMHLEETVKLAQEIGLPAEEGGAWETLAVLYAKGGHQVKARRASQAAARIILGLVETIRDDELRVGLGSPVS